jgi:hypothetical protein
MLSLAIIHQNPAAASALMWFGIVILALVAVLSVALWIVVARGRARQDVQDFDHSESDPAVGALRRRPLVVQRSPKPRGRDEPVVARLEPTGDSEPSVR